MSFSGVYNHGYHCGLVVERQGKHDRPCAKHDCKSDVDPYPWAEGQEPQFAGLVSCAPTTAFATAAVFVIFGGTYWRRDSHDFWIWGLGLRIQSA